MPSADITPKGKAFVMHETQFRSWQPGRFWAGTNFFCYGLGRATEFAVTNYNAGTPLQPNVATGIGFKSSPQFWKESKPDLELKLTGGQMAVLNHRGSGLGSFSYSHVSFRLPGAKTRLTGGGWAGTRQLFKRNTGGVLAGIEHPIGKRWIVLSEWFSGRHDFGFFIPGILFHPTKRQIIVAGYKIANRAVNGKAGIVLEYGITF
ncbi:MAG: hypothetical protein JNL98_32210 [Bryobacterales bacterium]|nr:hypothetical protein [Bryobacterales bacterium]